MSIAVKTRFLTSKRIALAYSVAIAVDLIQVPLNAAFFALLSSIVGSPGSLTVEAVDIGVDAVAACFLNALLGFHWALLPTCVLELVPGLDAAPTWTACVAYVVWRRKQDAKKLAQSNLANPADLPGPKS